MNITKKEINEKIKRIEQELTNFQNSLDCMYDFLAKLKTKEIKGLPPADIFLECLCSHTIALALPYRKFKRLQIDLNRF